MKTLFIFLYYHFDLPFFFIIDQRHLPMQKEKYQSVEVHILNNKKQQCIYLFLLLSAAPLRGHQNRSFVSLSPSPWHPIMSLYSKTLPLCFLSCCVQTHLLPRSLINSGTATHAGQQHWWQLPFLGGLRWVLASRGGVKT